MAYFMFRFHFPNLDSSRQEAFVECYGVQFPTSLKKSWFVLKNSNKYHGIKGLQLRDITIFKLNKKKPQGYLSWEERLPKILTAQQVADYQTLIY